VLEEPYVPIEFGSNQPGMQAGPALDGAKREAAEREWLRARDDAVRRVLGLVADPTRSPRATTCSRFCNRWRRRSANVPSPRSG
jgi:hypothetical protein